MEKEKIYKIKEIYQQSDYTGLSSFTIWGVIVFIGQTREVNPRNKG
jgi:hypothetical protein